MSVINQNLLMTPEGYQISRSVRLRSSASAYFSKALTTPTNNKIWTWSAWVKKGTLTSDMYLVTANGTTAYEFIKLSNSSADNIEYAYWNGSAYSYQLRSTLVLRDPSAWYHIVFQVDTTQATAANRVRIYVNNVEVTSFSISSYPSQNTNTQINSAIATRIGGAFASAYFDGYLTEVNFIDGQALTPSSFGETNPVTGVWQPKKYAGTYGTNGFYLNFSDPSAATAAAIGKDYSGNGNNWTPNNISVTAGVTYDSMLDVPTMWADGGNGRGNYAVLNPLYTGHSTLSNGNLTASGSTDLPTIIPDNGNWYFEIDGVSKNWTPPAAFPAAAGNYNFGQRPFTNTVTSGYKALNTQNLPDGVVKKGSTAFNIALDTGANIKTASEALFSGSNFLEWIKDRANANNHQLLNSVIGTTAVLQTNTQAAETTYSAPSGSSVGWVWKESVSSGFDIVSYAGSAGAQNVSHSLGVPVDFMIIKNRSSGIVDWAAYHKSLGNTQAIFPNLTNAASTSSTFWNNTSPTSSVFTVNTNMSVNALASNYVAYCFAEVAGFSKFGSVSMNGSADGAFVFTGFLPKLVMLKRTDTTSNWIMWDTVRNTYNVIGAELYPNLSNAESTVTDLDILSNGFKMRNSGFTGTWIYAAWASAPFKNSLAR